MRILSFTGSFFEPVLGHQFYMCTNTPIGYERHYRFWNVITKV